MASLNPAKKLYLVDGTSQLFRAYFAIQGLSNDDGLPTGAVYGFANMLRKLVQDEQPPYLGVAFDPGGPVFRHEAYEDYKANRPPAPEDLRVQVPYAKQVCEVLGIPVLELKGYEADDLIATYTAHARAAGFEVVVVASDKDLLQLVADGVTVLNPSKNLMLDAPGVTTSFGVPPERVRDVLGLMGDSVDNIPGVPGVGQKTALAVVGAYGDIEKVIERAGRFVAVYDARDAVVGAIDALKGTDDLSAVGAAALVEAAGTLVPALEGLSALEADEEQRARFDALREQIRTLDVPHAVEAATDGKKLVRTLAPLKRELKALDKGSSKRIWYAIRDNADQARLSKELATLHAEVPVEFDLVALERGSADRTRARALFDSLGFRALSVDIGEATVEVDTAAPVEVAAREVEIVTTCERLEGIVAECRAAGRVALEPIAAGADAMQVPLVGVALGGVDDRSYYVPVGHDYLGVPEQLPLAEVGAALAPLCADEVERIGHDVKRATHLLRRHGLPITDWALDTMVAAFLLNSSRNSFAIGSLAAEFLGRDIESWADVFGSGAKRREPREVEVERVGGYAGGAVSVVGDLADPLRSRLEESGLTELYRTIDGPLLPLLGRMEEHGIRIDTALLERMSGEMEMALDAARKEIHELAGGEFNVDSPKQMREVLFDRLGLKSRRKTAKSGALSTDAQALEELASDHPIAGRILEYRELSKLKSTYVDSLPRLVHPDTGRVHTSYHPTGAATGRLSSSDPNLQNIPVRSEAGRKIRAAFVPADGHVFLASDYSQIELRVLAHLCGDPDLISAFRAGEDIHRHTAAKIFGVAPEQVIPAMRRRAKAINFGILYGMSETRLAREQGMKRTEARKFIEAYFARFEKVGAYIERIREEARRDAAVRTLFGRVRLFPQLHQRTGRAAQEQALRAAVNTPLQGTAADLMKLAMLAVDRELVRQGVAARVLLQVHDELLLEVPEAEIDVVADLVRGAMEGAYRLDVPLVVDQKVGKDWMEVT